MRTFLWFLALAGWAAGLTGLTIFSDFHVRHHQALPFTLSGFFAGVCYLVLIYSGWRAGFLRQKRAMWWVIILAVAGRLILLSAAPGDDVWRYLWEGEVQWQGGNPYVLAPDSPELKSLRETWPHPMPNHPTVTAIYPPLVEMIFAMNAAWGGGLVGLKIIFALADLAVLAVLFRLPVSKLRRKIAAALYALNPLAIYSFAGGAHFDSLMILPLVGAIYFALRFRRALGIAWVNALSCAILLSVAIAIKATPILLLPAFALLLSHLPPRLNWRIFLERKPWKFLGSAPILLATPLCTLALAIFYGYPQIDIFSALREFSHWAEMNSLFIHWIDQSVPIHHWDYFPAYALWIAVAVTLAAIFAWIMPRRKNELTVLLWPLGLALLLSPVLHAWYLTWILPVAAVARSRFWLALSVSGFGYFLLWHPAIMPSAGTVAVHDERVWLYQILPALFLWAGLSVKARQGHEGR